MASWINQASVTFCQMGFPSHVTRSKLPVRLIRAVRDPPDDSVLHPGTHASGRAGLRDSLEDTHVYIRIRSSHRGVARRLPCDGDGVKCNWQRPSHERLGSIERATTRTAPSVV